MAQRGLSISEALKLLQELPSGSESENSDSDNDTEKYVPIPLELEGYQSDSDNVSNASEDDGEDLCQPGPSRSLKSLFGCINRLFRRRFRILHP